MSTRGEMSPPGCRRTSPPAASLPDDDDMLREILLRLPPRPSSLPRASLVCKRWRSLVADPQFQCRFRDHHGKPPLIGFFLDSRPFVPILDPPDRIPEARFSMPPLESYRIIDCRHGLVLFLAHRMVRRLVLWDPVAREQRRLIFPPELDNAQMFFFNGAVRRPARRQGWHFQVALIARDALCTRVSVWLYSSETGAWGNINSLQLQSIQSMPQPSTLIGNSFCWLFTVDHGCVILEFDLDRQSLAVIELPPHIDMEIDFHKLWIMPSQGGGLGFVHLSQHFHAQLWKRAPASDGLAVWVPDRAVEFGELRSTCKGDFLTLVGFDEESNAILVLTASGVFMVYLQPMEFKKLSDPKSFCHHYPFACFYPAGTAIIDGHDGNEVLNNM
ncbi:hypothetical protein CFC21_048660 [Triticum aestivum]|uniref:Uncharacterized protein n=3 Tax=Triticum aestivum TaxID=4565 RepID=A0A3B6GXS6_WHEAT|nr:hypothetical protein CFC21_048660 [Triticum aestivum]